MPKNTLKAVTARTLPATDENLQLAAAALRRGEVVGMPTETVYGLAGLALDEHALARIFATKDRPTFDPLIVHVAWPASLHSNLALDWLAFLRDSKLVDAARLGPLARERVKRLSALWPGPLTLVLPKQPGVPDLATSGLATVAIRAPRHPVAQALLRAVGQPLAAPSANRFGRLSPTSAADVQAELGDRIEVILDGGPCEIGLESTVVHVAENGDVTLLRPGGVTRESLELLVEVPVGVFAGNQTLETSLARQSPGLLTSHYAPLKPMYLLHVSFAQWNPEPGDPLRVLVDEPRGVGLLFYRRTNSEMETWLASRSNPPSRASFTVRALCADGDPAEAARNLFRVLRELDADPRVEFILAEPVPDATGLGHAIADRLRRASIPFVSAAD